MGIREKAIELAMELKRTPDFAELKQAKTAIDRVPVLRQELEAFNKRQNSLYSSQLPFSEAASRIEQLGKKYAELSKVPEIDRYLKASKTFNILLANVLKEVNGSIEAELK
jgi:cell fate (sporulation/competence/biofilm development) regulator YlbF (YheA/YmcA/DUF963 family)